MPSHSNRGPSTSTAILALPAALALVLALFCFLPKAQISHALQLSILGASVFLLLFSAILRHFVISSRRTLEVQFLPRPVHYVQLVMHSSVYAYWGWYWREVYGYVPLILAQILFAYALDILVCYSRRNKWIAGFGPIPIILSTNLFLWFRDDWFFLQFVMISIGVFGKEFIQWKRDGRNTHIFNPSAVGLFIFSVILIATHSTSITWGEQIAATLHRPPNIYLEIFVLGIIVQALFSVTLVTLSAAAMLFVLNLIYTRVTGVYQFIDSYIPVSVFLGLHLLVTDPATSPRSKSGKAIFGGLYGLCVFGLYSLLTLIGAPRFYDKLLCVPPLNLSVRVLDRIGDRLDNAIATFFERVRAPRLLWAGTPRQLNFTFMSIWIVLFGYMLFSGFVTTEVIGKPHPGSDPEFWAHACDARLHKACFTYVGMLNAQCEEGASSACLQMANLTDAGVVVPREPQVAGRGYGRACDLGEPGACDAFVNFIGHGGDQSLAAACSRGDPNSCFFLGTVLEVGRGVPQDASRALDLFDASCKRGYLRACGVLGNMYLIGQGTPSSATKALANFEKSCAGQWGQSCADAGVLYRRGDTGAPDEALAQRRFEQGCELGFQPACKYVAAGYPGAPIAR